MHRELRQHRTGQLLQLATLRVVKVLQRGGNGPPARRADPIGGGRTAAGEDDGVGAGVAPRSPSDVVRGLEPIDQAHRPRMRETDQLAQLLDRAARLGFVQGDEGRRRRVAQFGSNVSRRRDPVGERERERAHEVDQTPVVVVGHVATLALDGPVSIM